MFVQISPSEQDLSETLSSLNFAARVRGVELGPARKQVDTGEVQKLRNQVSSGKPQLTVVVFFFLSPFNIHFHSELVNEVKAAYQGKMLLGNEQVLSSPHLETNKHLHNLKQKLTDC
jgi:hypothetical protein